jgi:hypothetical protein
VRCPKGATLDPSVQTGAVWYLEQGFKLTERINVSEENLMRLAADAGRLERSSVESYD